MKRSRSCMNLSALATASDEEADTRTYLPSSCSWPLVTCAPQKFIKRRCAGVDALACELAGVSLATPPSPARADVSWAEPPVPSLQSCTPPTAFFPASSRGMTIPTDYGSPDSSRLSTPPRSRSPRGVHDSGLLFFDFGVAAPLDIFSTKTTRQPSPPPAHSPAPQYARRQRPSGLARALAADLRSKPGPLAEPDKDFLQTSQSSCSSSRRLRTPFELSGLHAPAECLQV